MSKYIKKELKKVMNFDDNIINFQDIELLENEEFVDLKTSLYPEIKSIYKISNKNRIYSTESNKLLSVKVKKHSNGYYQVNLQAEYENCPYSISKSYPMHRLMMSVFNPVDNMSNLFINHKDGIKTNNELSNLEWCTASENTRHAIQTGLYAPKKGEECSYATIDIKTAKRVCKMFMSGKYTKREIADLLGISKSIVVDITTGVSWKSVSKDYDFTKRIVYRRPKNFSIDWVYKFCEYFQNHPKNKDESVRQYMIRTIIDTDFKKDNSEINENLLYSLRYLYLRKSYKNINSHYTY